MASGLHLCARSQDESGSCVAERFGVSCALILTLNSVGCTQIYLCSSCNVRLMYARMRDLMGSDFGAVLNIGQVVYVPR